jgi:hypothetical protein
MEAHIEKQSDDNRSLQSKLDGTILKLNQCDYELEHASEQLANLSQEIVELNQKRGEMSTSHAEIGILKGDISRLLSLLEYSPATREWVEQWRDSDGCSFLGIDTVQSSQQFDMIEGSNNANNHSANMSFGHTVHTAHSDITPAEFAHLKRVHGADPFPMTATFGDELEYW